MIQVPTEILMEVMPQFMENVNVEPDDVQEHFSRDEICHVSGMLM